MIKRMFLKKQMAHVKVYPKVQLIEFVSGVGGY